MSGKNLVGSLAAPMPASKKNGPVLHIKYRGTNIGWNADMTEIATGIARKASPTTVSERGSAFDRHAPSRANSATPAPNPGSGAGSRSKVITSDIRNR